MKEPDLEHLLGIGVPFVAFQNRGPMKEREERGYVHPETQFFRIRALVSSGLVAEEE